jgi:hypothetical protein
MTAATGAMVGAGRAAAVAGDPYPSALPFIRPAPQVVLPCAASNGPLIEGVAEGGMVLRCRRAMAVAVGPILSWPSVLPSSPHVEML